MRVTAAAMGKWVAVVEFNNVGVSYRWMRDIAGQAQADVTPAS